MKTETSHITDYREILSTYGLQSKPYNYYWQVGEIKQVQGWTLWLSVIQQQVVDLCHALIPSLVEKNIPFRILQDFDTAGRLLEGTLGYPILGMVMGVYPKDDAQALQLAKWLIQETAALRGPAIPSARHLGGIVYTRYGGISPIIRIDTDGQTKEFIYDESGVQIPDPYAVPFSIPKKISWPFESITTLYPPKRPKLINGKYFPLQTIKSDAKGEVTRGLYFKKFWQIRSCIIKQAKHDMLADAYGRDIQDRLRWQYELYQALHKDIPMPEVFDFFEENGDTYLAMQFVDGLPITGLVERIFKNQCWRHLSSSRKSTLLGVLISTVDIIRRMHEKGYVHRDINPDNFIIDKAKQIILIDMELSYNIAKQQPVHPFQLGTQGHMSPEQMKAITPTVKEDIFGIGALLTMALTGLHAMKINTREEKEIRESMECFTGVPELAALIARCCSKDPARRPAITEILTLLKAYKDAPEAYETARLATKEEDEEKLDRTIRYGISGLAHDKLHVNGKWVSLLESEEEHVGNTQISVTINQGWHTGVSGVLWLLARAYGSGYSVDEVQFQINESWRHLQDNYFSRPDSLPPGLYHGSAGIAMAITENLRYGLLDPHPGIIEDIELCFRAVTDDITLANGVAGQGIALLNASDWLDKDFVKNGLASYFDRISKSQQADGSWLLLAPNSGKKGDILTGLEKGVSGILWFLLHYYSFQRSEATLEVLMRGINWLTANAQKSGEVYFWTMSTKTKNVDRWNAGQGISGIALLYTHAWQILGTQQYRTMAETCLETIPPNPVRKDISLAEGMISLGEVFIDAANIFKSSQWEERAKWVENILLSTATEMDPAQICWQTAANYTLTADLYTGASGVLNYILRCKNPDNLGHPITPKLH